MPDLHHYVGADLTVAASGDLATVSGTQEGVQRVLRRLLTNPGAYVWHPAYGAGLPAKVGSLATADEIRGLIRQHMSLEPAVAKVPAADIKVDSIPNGVAVQIRYVDAQSEEPVFRAFSITR